MSKKRLDLALFDSGLVSSRSQAVSYIKLGKVKLGKEHIVKPGHLVALKDIPLIKVEVNQQYVSRAALKLASVVEGLGVDFKGKTVMDIGSSTGGFSDFALRHGTKKVIAIEKGKEQLHPKLREDHRIELHEQTDIRDFKTDQKIDVALIDVSFISLREILPSITSLISKNTLVLAMVKPQFEAKGEGFKHKGVIKNDQMRRLILKSFEDWVKKYFVVIKKQDSGVSGAKGNKERFYLLKKSH